MIADLTARLLAAIGAKEARARAAYDGPWTAVYVDLDMLDAPDDVHLRFGNGEEWTHLGVEAMATAEFVVDDHPKAVLRRCAADRRVVDMYLTELRVEQEDNPDRIGAARMWGGGKLSGARIAVVLLADGYGLVKADDVFSQMAFGTEWDAAHPDSKEGSR